MTTFIDDDGIPISPSFSHAQRQAFLDALASGLTIAEAAQQAHTSPFTVLQTARLDPAFRLALNDALEISSSAFESILRSIALDPKSGGMARVRALEKLLSSRSARFRDSAPIDLTANPHSLPVRFNNIPLLED